MKDTIIKWCSIIDNAEINLTLTQGNCERICPRCKTRQLRKLKWGYACSGYRGKDDYDCNFFIGKNVRGTTLKDEDLEELLDNGRTRYINDFVAKETGQKYGMYMVLSDNGNIEFTNNTGVLCPVCNKNSTQILFSQRLSYQLAHFSGTNN